MNVFEHLMVFSTVVLVTMYLWWQMQTFKVPLGNTEYPVFTANNSIFDKIRQGSSVWYYNSQDLMDITKPLDYKFTVDGKTYNLWYDV